MKYIYDINLNFNEILYDFFEWNKSDNIIHTAKIPIIEIKKKDFVNSINNIIKFNNNFLKLIKKKDKLFYLLLKYKNNIIALKINKDGIASQISSLKIEDELDISELKMPLEKNYNYEIIRKRKKINTTRQEYKNITYIEDVINNLNIKKDSEKISYIYLEYFGKKEKNITKAFNELKANIKYEKFNLELKTLFNFITNQS